MHYKLIPNTAAKSLSARIKNKIYREFIINPARRKTTGKLIEAIPPFPDTSEQDFSIHTLIGSNYVEMAIAGYKVFNYVCGENFKITLHDDGTLTANDHTRLKHHLNCKIISRKEADEQAAEALKYLPGLSAFRSSQVMALKFIDVKLFCTGYRNAYIDVDILFFRHPDFFLKSLKDQTEQKNYFNKDIDNAYISSMSEIYNASGLLPLERANAGLWVINAKDINLERAEAWIDSDYFQQYKTSYRLEQTFISMLANNSEKGAAHLPSGYDVDLFKKPEDAVCKHYVGQIRHGFELEGLQYILDNISSDH